LAVASGIGYTVAFPEPHTHYLEVEMEVKPVRAGKLDFRMPAWAPGSYLIREFGRHVESFSAFDMQGRPMRHLRQTKDTWTLPSVSREGVRVRYKVYANELTVRTSHVDDSHAHLNGTSVFMYVQGMTSQPCTVKVIPHSEWKILSVALDRLQANDPWCLVAADYDKLVDAPFEIGNQVVFKFEASGIPHEVAMFGEGNYDTLRLKRDMAKIVSSCTEIFGENPCKRYVFIVHNLPTGGGGLEHENSTTLQTTRWSYSTESSYQGFLSLVAHEYFHLWNVKRLRPFPLGPFDYSEENYTPLLWLAEGFTAYYDDLITYRCGFYTETEYLGALASSMSYCTNIRGASYQSLAESSTEAWIKFYRPHENSSNATVSYYTKGAVVGALLDMKIIQATGGKKSLDDVMKAMYLTYFKKLDRGFTEKEFIGMAEQVAGVPLQDFFDKYVNGTESLPMTDVMRPMGLVLKDLNAVSVSSSAWTGMTTSVSAGKLTVTAIERNSPAWKSGLSVNDELIAIDGFRLADDLSKFLGMRKPGNAVKFTVARSGIVREFSLLLEAPPHVKYAIDKIPETDGPALALYSKWAVRSSSGIKD
jgi:predicted metalloprotease with PDZ domain